MNFLIVKASSLGDIIQAFPVASYLRTKFPNCTIDWVVEKKFADLVETHPYINHVFRVNTQSWRNSFWKQENRKEMIAFKNELRKYKYDAVFDLQGNTKSGLIMAFAKSNRKIGYGFKTVWEWPNCFFSNVKFNPPLERNAREECLYLATQFCKDENPVMIDSSVNLKINANEKNAVEKILTHPTLDSVCKVMVCPGSNWRNKQLSPESFLQFLKYLQPFLNCSFLFIWGSPAEKEVAERLASEFPKKSIVVDKLRLPALQNLMGKIDLVIAMDSLPLHLAGTTATKTFSVFGASSMNKYKPLGDPHKAMQGPCPYHRSFERRCPVLRTCPTGLCIQGLSGRQIFDQFKKCFPDGERT